MVEQLPKKIALVHEWFSSRSFGGAENVVFEIDKSIASLDRTIDFFSLIDDLSEDKNSWLYGRSVQTSLIQKLPFGKRYVQSYLPLLPYAIEQLDLSDYPIVLSSSHLVSKGVITSPDQLHLSYIHTPVRYAWDQMNVYLRRSKLSQIGFEPIIRWQLHRLRQWDQLSSLRLDNILANSNFTARRISKYWGRKAQVVHPPVNVDRFRPAKDRENYYLCLCRLVPNKKVDVVVEAFNNLQLPLIVVGDGPEKEYLKKIASSNVDILGFQTNEVVEELMRKCRAYIYAGVEDFGIAPVEAMASGAPVIAFGEGGLLDTVKPAKINMENANIDNATGVFFQEQTVDSLIDVIRWFEDNRIWRKFSSEYISNWAQNFSPKSFDERFKHALLNAWTSHLKLKRKHL